MLEAHQDLVMTKDHPTDYRTMLLMAFIVVIVVNGLLIGWGWWLREQQPTAVLSELVVESRSTAVCPGDTLEYSFVLTVSRPAHVELKTSEQRLSRGERISFARLQEFTFVESTTLEIGRKWVVPKFYRQPLTGQDVPWEPGGYEQITDANVTGRSEISQIKVPFSIRSDCEG